MISGMDLLGFVDFCLVIPTALHTYTHSYERLELLRASKLSFESINGFIDSFEKLVEQYSFVSDLVINGNESLVADTIKSMLRKAFVNVNARKHSAIGFFNDNLRTILPFVSVSGIMWIVVYIFKTKSTETQSTIQLIYISSTTMKTRDTWSTYYATTDKGFM
jgi:hypothetical protein